MKLAEIQAYTQELNAEVKTGSDRGVVLLLGSILDDYLYRILKSFMIDNAAATEQLLGVNRPLSEFSGKIDLCHALGLIATDEAKVLHKIREIRNGFAHKIGIKLTDQPLKDKCKHLYDSLLDVEPDEVKGDPRAAFIYAASTMRIILMGRINEAQQQKRTPAADDKPLNQRTMYLDWGWED
ncbi:hypothetical protein GOA77_09360 [Sinorhizobium meliloti]|nr:hypothetical protein [Sinorhizobium meliloti]